MFRVALLDEKIVPVFEASRELILIIIAFIAVISYLAFRFSDRYVFADSRPDLPGPSGIPLLGNTFQAIANNGRMTTWLEENTRKYGPLWSITMPGWGRNILVNHPRLLEHIRKRDTQIYTKGSFAIAIFQSFPGPHSPLATDGAEWRTHRRIMAPVFAMKNFDSSVSRSMNEILPIARDLLISAANTGATIDWNKFCSRLSIMLFTKTAFNANTNGLTSDLSCLSKPDEIGGLLTKLNLISASRLFNPFWGITEKLNGTHKHFEITKAKLHSICDSMIASRQEMFKSAQDQNIPGADADNEDFLGALLTSDLSAQQIREVLIMLIFAGNDNTVNVLGWSLDYLSKDLARIQRESGKIDDSWIHRMRAEANGMSSGAGEVTKYNDINNFPVHLAVFHETLRLRPGVPKNARYVEQDDVLPPIPEAGLYEPIKVYKGNYVGWSDFTMMRDENVWGTDSREFNPGRFLDESDHFIKPPIPKFHAFGQGPRYCPGAQLATYQFIAIWSFLLPSFDIEPLNADEERVMSEAFTSNMESEFLVRIKRIS